MVQGAVGFASGLIGVPLLVLAGFSLAEAATINLVATSVQNVTGAWKLWPHLDTRELAFPVLVRWLAIPCGTYVAYLADQRLDPTQAKQLIGLFLLAVVSLLWGCKISPRDRLNLGWQTLAFSTSGFLMGFAAIGGAPMVVYVNSLTWTASKSRAFLFFCSAAFIACGNGSVLARARQKNIARRGGDNMCLAADFCRLVVRLSIGAWFIERLFGGLLLASSC